MVAQQEFTAQPLVVEKIFRIEGRNDLIDQALSLFSTYLPALLYTG